MILLDAVQSLPFDLWSYLLQQAPVVVILAILCYFLYKLILKRDAVIKEKDSQLLQDSKELRFLYGEAIKAQNKTTEALQKNHEIQLRLLDLVKEVKEEIKDDLDNLKELIYKKQ